VILLAAAGFALMFAHGVVRPTASALFLQHFAAQDMLWGMALVPLLVTVMMWPYGRLLDRRGPRGALIWTSALSLALLVAPAALCAALGAGGEAGLTVGGVSVSDASAFLLYVWNDAFVVLLVEQFWALANSTNTVESGKRRYGLLLFIGGLGATGGNQAVARLAPLVGTWPVFFFGVMALVPFAWLMGRVYGMTDANTTDDCTKHGRDAGRAQGELGRSKRWSWGLGRMVGLAAIRGSSYLAAIAAIVGLGQAMVAPLDVVFQHHVAESFTGLDATSSYEGDFWSAVNGASMGLQILTPLVLRLVSVGLLHVAIPLTHVGCVLALLLFPCLPTAAVAFAWFKVVDYSVFRACKEVLYVPLDFDARYRAKMLIDMVVYRTTKGGAALALALARTLGGTLIPFLPAVTLAAAVSWLPLGAKVGRHFESRRSSHGY